MYKEFWIYRITNLITNKFYIGQTRNLYNRLKSHKSCKDKNTIIVKSILKYGWENHQVDILFNGFNIIKKEADELEKYYIRKYNSYCKFNKMGMNLTDGGYYGSISTKSRNRQAQDNFIKWKKKLSKENSCLIVLNKDGELLMKLTGDTFYKQIDNIDKFSIQRKDAIRSAISKKMWVFTDKKYIIGFEDENIYEKYLLERERNKNLYKLGSITDARLDSLREGREKRLLIYSKN